MEKKNIFEGAKFGDLFVTRNGHQACYLGTGNFGYPKVEVLNYYGVDNPVWNWDGTYTYRDSQWDIVGKGSYNEFAAQLHKTVDEEKLDKLATKWGLDYINANTNMNVTIEGNTILDIDITKAFKAGYKKAMEE